MPYKNPEEQKEYNHNRYISDKKKFRNYELKRRLETPEKYLLHLCKSRARYKGIKFNITEEDLIIPKKCPITGIKLQSNSGHAKDSSPTIDRVNNSKGYVKGNVRVISWKANKYKSDMNLKTMRKLLAYMEGKI